MEIISRALRASTYAHWGGEGRRAGGCVEKKGRWAKIPVIAIIKIIYTCMYATA